MKKNEEYSLGTFTPSGGYSLNDNFIRIFTAGYVNDIEHTTTHTNASGQTIVVTYKLYSALTNFKRAVFTCKDVKYDENTGRIKEMVFEQYKTNDDVYYN